ncbi:MAG: hypothetical protein IID45_06355 [Planctomycetes bacterium]|nr:hypothetical protein [Planctomycetota bacterium]
MPEFSPLVWFLLGLGSAMIVGLFFAWKPLRAGLRAREAAHGISLFRMQRERLEAKFFDLAAASGKPRGLRWVECEWFSAVAFARDLTSGLLTAFVAVNVRFEAVEGSDMEEVAAVGTIRDATALFHFRHGQWGTGGRALFNMNPEDAISRLQGQFELIVEN